MRRKGSGSFYLSFLQYWSNFPRIHPAYFGRICTSLSSLLPLHWKLFLQQFRVLDVFQLFEWFPYLEQPQKKASQVLADLTVQVRVGARMTWTVLALGVFLVMEQTPIFGLRVSEPDYLVWLRPLIASSKGSVALFDFTRLTHQLMELGMFPIGVISVVSFFVEMFSWWEPVPIRKGDSDLRQTAKAAFAVLVIFGLSLVYVQTPLVEIKPVGELTRLLVVLQLAGGGIVVYLLDEVLGSYGMCPVFTLFMASNTCKSFLWLAFSPVTIDIGRGPEFEGSVLCLIHLLLSWRNKSQAVYESLLRQNQPNLITLGSSLFVLVAIIYLQGQGPPHVILSVGVRVELPMMSTSKIGQCGTFPIKLLYSPENSIMFLFQMVHQILFVTQLGTILSPEIWEKWFQFLGTWEMDESKYEFGPVAGLCYWLTPPTWRTLLADRLRTFVYITYVLLTCALLSRWAISDEDCEENPENVIADLLGPTQITLAIMSPNPDEALKREVRRLVPTASILGGLALGCICVTSDVFGVIGGGQGMLVTTNIIYKGYELWLKEQGAFSGRILSAE